MVAKQKRSAFISHLILLWSFTVLTRTTVDAAANIDQHMRLANQGGQVVDQRGLINRRLSTNTFLKTIELLLPMKTIATSGFYKTHIPASLMEIMATNYLAFSSSKEAAIHTLFDVFNVKNGASRLLRSDEFRRWDNIITTVLQHDCLERDKAMYAVLEKHLSDGEMNQLTSLGQSPGKLLSPEQLYETLTIHQRFDTVVADRSISLTTEPVIDVSITSSCSNWLKNKNEEEQGDAIVLLLDTMRSKGITNELSTLIAAAEGNGVFQDPIRNHIQRVAWKESGKSPEDVFRLLFPADILDIQEVLQSKSLLNWIDFIKLIRKDPNELLLRVLQEYWGVPMSAIALHELKSLHCMIFPIHAYKELLDSWKDQSYTVVKVAQILKPSANSPVQVRQIGTDYAWLLFNNNHDVKREMHHVIWKVGI